ncbi:MAG: hypothetical protein ILA26_00750 [Methanobrevibacter sp.]|nr:hypothetical protein [Methanobrevibacter sp.]
MYLVGEFYRKKALVNDDISAKELASKYLNEALRFLYQAENPVIEEIKIKHDIASVSTDIVTSLNILTEININGVFDDDIAALYFDKKDFDKAISYYQKFIERNFIMSIAALINKATIYMKINKINDAETNVNSCINLINDMSISNNYLLSANKLYALIFKFIILYKKNNHNDLNEISRMILDMEKNLLNKNNADGFIVGIDDSKDILSKSIDNFKINRIITSQEETEIINFFKRS